MSLRLYDTRTRSVREFVPLEPGRAGVYVCGPTVQAPPHVGHLRSAVAFDVLRRWLVESGYEVTFVRNVTDVDDKIIHDAAHADEPSWQLAARMHRAFTAAYDALGVLPPTVEPLATGHITQMLELIQTLLDADKAYVSDGDVYLSVRGVEGYGALSGQSPDALRASEKQVGHGMTGAKQDALDFALWKAAKPGEPSWPAPWGRGRPGWHLECSAMAVAYLGTEFDIHGGGVDLVFPHHENEVAQSTSAGHPFARYWLHHGLITLAGGEKMSKSLGNSMLVGDLLAAGARPQALRYLLGSAHYRSGQDWSAQALAEAEATYARVETFLTNAAFVIPAETVAPVAGAPEVGAPGTGAYDDVPAAKQAWESFAEAMDDDLAVPRALGVLHEAVRQGNAALAAADHLLVPAWVAVVRRMLGVLGLDPVTQWPDAGGSALEPVVDALVQVALAARAAARDRKDWASADAIRESLAAAGLVVEDTADGVRWKVQR